MKNYFISYTSTDRAWAEWIAWQLEDEGHSVIVQAWDFNPGSNFVLQMEDACKSAEKTIAILSQNYLDKLFTKSEWAAAFAQDPTGEKRKLLPVRVEPITVNGLLAQVVYIDLLDLDEQLARKKLLDGIRSQRGKPNCAPNFPGTKIIEEKITTVFPGTKDVSRNNDKDTAIQLRFVHTKINGKGLLDLEHYENPYSGFDDPTDPQELPDPSAVYAFAWMPMTNHIKSDRLKRLTPVAAICTVDPKKVIDTFISSVGADLLNKFLHKTPKELYGTDKEFITSAMAESLSESFLLGGSISSLVLGIGRTNSKVAYQAIINMFLLPLLQMHRKQGFEQFHLRLSNVGEETASLLSYSKTVVKASFPLRNLSSVDILKDKDDYIVLQKMAHLLAWAVGTFYDSGSPRLVQIIEEVIHKKSRTLST